MTEKSSAQVATPAPEDKTTKASPKKVATQAKSAVRVKAHPSTALMVKAAIKTLAEKNGSSLQAIKKYITGTYNLDAEKLSSFIRKFLKSAVADGTLVQVKGKGANGSFKLPVVKAAVAKPKPKAAGIKKSPAVKKPVAKKPAPKKTDTKPAAKKAAPKKEATKTSAEKKPVKAATKVAKPKASPKAKKVTKSPTAKPKAPKPKKVTPKSPKPAKKATAKK